MDNHEIFELLKDNSFISYTEHFDKYIIKRITKSIDFLKAQVSELPEGYESYEELLYCVVNNDDPTAHICPFCGNKTLFINATRGYKNGCLDKRCKWKKIKRTCFEKYGVSNPAQSQQVKDKTKKTNLEKYGYEYALSNKDVIEKRKATCLERYGVDNVWKAMEIKDKITDTFMDKYQVEHFAQTPEFHKSHRSLYLYDNLYFDSSWELYFYIYCKENAFDIVKSPCRFEYEFNGKIHYYVPDFKVGDELIEIKGDHFFDKSGSLINPYDHAQDDAYEAKYKCMLDNLVKILRYAEMKDIIDFVDCKYTSDFVDLFKINLPFPYLNQNLKDKTDLGLIHHFHKSIYDANIDKHLSPVQVWPDKGIIKKVALNRLKYVGKCRPEDILQGFNVTKIAPKVSVFNPILAKRLIVKYLNCFNEVFDPFSGFSGRMLGAVTLGKHYIGQDLNPQHVEESLAIIKYKKIEDLAQIRVQNVLSDVPSAYECLFTCPPYGSKEHWNGVDEIIKSCDEWIDLCLSKYKCKHYLFVVDNTDKFKDNIVEELNNKSHFSNSKEYVLLF